MTHRAGILLGSNIEPLANIMAAVGVLRASPHLAIVSCSSVYRTPAVGPPGQPPFANAAVLVDTSLEPEELRSELRKLEHLLGRVRTDDRSAPRTIDLDLLFFDDVAGDFGEWTLPDDALTQPHALVPMAEIAPNWVPAGGRRTLGELATTVDRSTVEILGSVVDGIQAAFDEET